MKLLFDASSMFQAIKSLDEEQTFRILAESFILDLTKYEVGNILWKEMVLHHSINEKELHELLGLFSAIILKTKALTTDAGILSEVADVATKDKITFYDASYITIAKSKNLTLVTEDTRLAKVASKYTNVASSREIPLG